jgi:hypothetical protein
VIEWNIIRAAGIGAYIMLWMSVVWGLVSTTGIFGNKISKGTANVLHQSLSTLGVLLLATHLGFLLIDKFMPFTPIDLVIPMRVTYKPVGVALGISAMMLMVVGVIAISWGRRFIGTRLWRAMHVLSIPAFALALVHGLMTGTDTRRPEMWWMYVITACVVVFFLIMRALTFGERPKRAAVPEGIPLSIAGPSGGSPRDGAVPGTPLVPAVSPSAPVGPADGAPDNFRPPRHRTSPLAKRHAPVEVVKENVSSAPPLLRVHDDFGVLARPEGEAPLDETLDEDWPVLGEDPNAGAPAFGGTARPSGRRGDGHAPDPQTERDVGRGHAPRPRPSSHSPDGG